MAVNSGGIYLLAIGCAIDGDRHGFQIGKMHSSSPIHIADCMFDSDRKPLASGRSFSIFRDGPVRGRAPQKRFSIGPQHPIPLAAGIRYAAAYEKKVGGKGLYDRCTTGSEFRKVRVMFVPVGLLNLPQAMAVLDDRDSPESRRAGSAGICVNR